MKITIKDYKSAGTDDYDSVCSGCGIKTRDVIQFTGNTGPVQTFRCKECQELDDTPVGAIVLNYDIEIHSPSGWIG